MHVYICMPEMLDEVWRIDIFDNIDGQLFQFNAKYN